MYHITQLENGLTVATTEMSHMSSVSVGIWFAMGSRYEAAAQNGVCHFIEHLLFKGTRKRTAKQISEAIEGIGGYLNAFTSEESTCFLARAGQDRFEELLDVLMDMVLHSRFNPVDVRKEREVIKEEIAMYLDQPHHQVQELLNTTLWPDQPLGRPITGTPATLDRITPNSLRGFLEKKYVAGNALVVAAGRITHRDAVKAVKRQSKAMERGKPEPPEVASEEQSQPRVRLLTRKTEQTQVALGIRTCSRHDERRYALRLLNTILGENMSSRLFQVIREDRGLAYSIYSSPSHFDDTGDIVIAAGLDTGNSHKTLSLILRELKRLRDRPPSAAELKRARDYVVGQMDLSLESTENQMNWIGEQWLGYGKVLSADEVRRRLTRVSPREIQSVARNFFRVERMNLALVSPIRSAKHLAKLVERADLS